LLPAFHTRSQINVGERHRGGRHVQDVLVRAHQRRQDGVSKGTGLLEWSSKIAPQGFLVAGTRLAHDSPCMRNMKEKTYAHGLEEYDSYRVRE